MNRRVIRANGTEESIPNPVTIMEAMALINADCVDVVNLLDGWTMIVDDAGAAKNLTPNKTATALYHFVCKPGTTWEIRGDVVIVLDAEFGDDFDY